MKQILPYLDYSNQCGHEYEEYISLYDTASWQLENEEKKYATDNTQKNDQNTEEVKQAQTVIKNETKGTIYANEELERKDFLLNHIFVVDSNTSMTDSETALDNLLTENLKVEDLHSGSEPKILIFHTHGSEAFADSRTGETEDTVIGVGRRLTDILETKYHIPVYHDETLYDVIDGKLDRSKAYDQAYANVSEILKQNPSIEVAIDLHRDGVDEETHLVTQINEKPTAKIMFLNGVSRSNQNGDISYLENPNKLMNLAFSFQMYLEGKEEYGDYVRKIYVRSLRYNLHILPRTALIEVGAQNNTVEEEKNAMEPLAAILDKVLSK